MKLVELLARELVEWPEDAHVGIQDADLDNTIWFLERSHNNIEFKDGAWYCHGSSFDILISRPSCLASDYDTAIVGYDEWEDERKRISQPQAEEVKLSKAEARRPFMGEPAWTVIDEAPDYSVGQWHQIDGPIKWRDTVNELDAYIEEFTREREALINRLALEGFALLPAMTPVAGVADIDMSDWRNWQKGDVVEVVIPNDVGLPIGRTYTVKKLEHAAYDGGMPVCVYDGEGDEHWPEDENYDGKPVFKFVMRP